MLRAAPAFGLGSDWCLRGCAAYFRVDFPQSILYYHDMLQYKYNKQYVID